MKDFCIANRITIGWFGVPGRVGGMTHLVNQSENDKVLCGTHFSPEAEYQWCFPSWRDGEPECERCKKIKAEMYLKNTVKTIIDNASKSRSKTNVKVHFSSATNEWATPQPLFNWLNNWHQFTLDPCCTKKTAKCPKYFTKAQNGLEHSWANECVFMNPPYRREIGKWLKKAYEESLKGATVVCLVPARTDTQYWRDYCLHAHNICFLTGRVKFIENGVALKDGAPFPSAIVTFQPPSVRSGSLQCWWKDLKDVMNLQW